MSDLDILNELLEASPAVRRAMKAYLHKAFQRGQRHGERAAREKFDELLYRVHTVSHLNGATGIFKAAWDEAKHPRNHGQFASAPGNSGDSSAPASTNRIEHPADKHIRSLAERIRTVPKRIRVKVAHLVRKKYEGLVEKFGKNGARAIIAASVMMLPVPLPGASMIPIALAHAVAKIRSLVSGERVELAKAIGPEPSRDELEAAAREFIEGIYREMGEEPPEIPEELDLEDAGEPDAEPEEIDTDDADTPIITPEDDDTSDAVALALLEHTIDSRENGVDPEPGLRAILDAAGDEPDEIHKAFKEEDHPRDHGKFSEKPGAEGESKPESKPSESAHEEEPSANGYGDEKRAKDFYDREYGQIFSAGVQTGDHTAFHAAADKYAEYTGDEEGAKRIREVVGVTKPNKRSRQFPVAPASTLSKGREIVLKNGMVYHVDEWMQIGKGTYVAIVRDPLDNKRYRVEFKKSQKVAVYDIPHWDRISDRIERPELYKAKEEAAPEPVPQPEVKTES